MEEDPLIPLVHVWNNAAFDHASCSAWHAHSPARATPTREAAAAEGDKENHRPDADADEPDVEAEIGHIEAEILRLSSRLHHLRTSSSSKHPEPKPKPGEAAPAPAAKAKGVARPRGLSLGPLDVAAVNPNPLAAENKQQQQPPRAAQGLKPMKQAPAPAAARGRGVSLGPLDILAANPRAPSAAATTANPRVPSAAAAPRPILRPIKEPPVQRRRGVSLGPMEIHNGVGGTKPGAATAAAAARVKPFASKLGAVREEGGPRSKPHAVVPARPWPSSNARQGTAASRAKAARSGSMSPSRSRRQSTSSKAAAGETTRAGGNAKAAAAEAARGGNAAALVASKVGDEVKPKGVSHTSGNAATVKRPAGSSKVRVVPSRYSITPGSSVAAAVAQEKRGKQSLPGSAGGAAGQREIIRAKLTEPSNDELSPETLGKVADLLPKIRTMPPSDESPRDSGCAKRVADLVGKRSFFTAAADDGNLVTPYQARVVELESPEEAAAEAEAEAEAEA